MTVTGTPPATSATIGTDERDLLHLQGDGDERGRHGPGVGGLERDHPVAASCTTCTIWPASATPATPSTADAAAVELGVKFTSDLNASVTGIRFYKGAGNTGTHIGSLWTAAGTKLRVGDLRERDGQSGWQQVTFATPVHDRAGAVYVARTSRPPVATPLTPATSRRQGVDNPPLHALKDGVERRPGVYGYGVTSAFPNNSFNADELLGRRRLLHGAARARRTRPAACTAIGGRTAPRPSPGMPPWTVAARSPGTR